MSGSGSPRWRVVGVVLGHLCGWALFALGFAAWCVVFPITVQGFGDNPIERGLVHLWGGIFAVLAGAGTWLLVEVITWRRPFAKVVFGTYVVLLCAVVLGAVFGAR